MKTTMTAVRRLLAGGLFGAATLVAVIAWGHGGKSHGKAAPVSSAEQAAYDAAKPAFERHCVRCHSHAGETPRAKAINHIDMSSYPFGGHHPHDSGAVIRRSLLGDKAKGKDPSMPRGKPGSVVGADLEKILAWADAFEKAHAPQ